MSLGGRVAIVTGGAQSIGAAIVRELVGRGAQVVVVDLAQNPGERLVAELGEPAVFVRADIGDPADRDRALEVAVDRFGGVDVLVNNAVDPRDGGEAAGPERWLAAYNVNVVAAAMLMLACRSSMRARGGGVVVNIASVSAHRAQEGRWVYNASKAALLQLTRSAARDLAPDGIRVVSVTPAWTVSRAIPSESTPAAAYHALGRIGRAEEVARVVAFVCSDDASFVTGSEIPVDGGYLALGPEG
jgi:NAD(P)-dependent dehydrogenase (short-subunit alcohol dehydrogenase family)